MKHLVYKTTNLVNSKYYIGVHSCKCNPYCSYLGSGTALKAAIQKHGRENFSRRTLKVFTTREAAFKYERKIVNKLDSKSYNLIEGGSSEYSKGRSKTFNLFGRTFNSKLEAAKYHSVSRSTITRWLNGSIKNPKSNERAGSPSPCLIKGKKFLSQTEAANYFRVSPSSINKFLNGKRNLNLP